MNDLYDMTRQRPEIEEIVDLCMCINPTAANGLFADGEMASLVKPIWDKRECFDGKAGFATALSDAVRNAKLEKLADH